MPAAFGTTVARGPFAFSIATRGGGSRGPPDGRRGDAALARDAGAGRGRTAPHEDGLPGNARARLGVEEPGERQRIAIGIGRARRVEGHGRADRRVEDQRAPCPAGRSPRPSGCGSPRAASLIVQSIRAAKSCWNAVRQRQIVAWSDV